MKSTNSAHNTNTKQNLEHKDQTRIFEGAFPSIPPQLKQKQNRHSHNATESALLAKCPFKNSHEDAGLMLAEMFIFKPFLNPTAHEWSEFKQKVM